MTAGAFFASLAVVAIPLEMTWTGLVAVALMLYATLTLHISAHQGWGAFS
jgi:hypothetical protein